MIITRVIDKDVEVKCENFEICKSWIRMKDLDIKTWNVCTTCEVNYKTKLFFINNKRCNHCFRIKRCVSVPSSSEYICIDHFK